MLSLASGMTKQHNRAERKKAFSGKGRMFSQSKRVMQCTQ